jgi:hypothetical protein
MGDCGVRFWAPHLPVQGGGCNAVQAAHSNLRVIGKEGGSAQHKSAVCGVWVGGPHRSVQGGGGDAIQAAYTDMLREECKRAAEQTVKNKPGVGEWDTAVSVLHLRIG